MTRPLLPLSAYIASGDPSLWRDSREEFFLNLTAHSRLRVIPQTHSELGEGLYRSDALAEQGISCAEEDVRDLVTQVRTHLCDHLSIRQLTALVQGLKEELEQQKAERARLFATQGESDTQTSGQGGQ